ncbi:MAG: hypothetical protein P8J46_00565 [Alphaproteobacteria bacterium]|nr:hypothetical protein [Alphaproteobacteria bacterium]
MSNYDFSYDPVTALSEDQAKGKIAEIFSDIRKTMNIPLITSIWRGLAGMNNSLEEVWTLTKPIYLTGTPELALTKMINSVYLPIPNKFNHKEFSQKDITHIRNIIKVYNKSNGMNLMALSAFISSEYKPSINLINTNIKKNILEPEFPKLLNKEEISIETWNIVKNVNSIGSPKGINSHVATLWRHLAYWPNFLLLVYTKLKSIEEKGEILKASRDMLNYIKVDGINLKRQKSKYNISEETFSTIQNYVKDSNQVIRMVVIGNILDKWIK